jgi:hypothetical protein
MDALYLLLVLGLFGLSILLVELCARLRAQS